MQKVDKWRISRKPENAPVTTPILPKLQLASAAFRRKNSSCVQEGGGSILAQQNDILWLLHKYLNMYLHISIHISGCSFGKLDQECAVWSCSSKMQPILMESNWFRQPAHLLINKPQMTFAFHETNIWNRCCTVWGVGADILGNFMKGQCVEPY